MLADEATLQRVVAVPNSLIPPPGGPGPAPPLPFTDAVKQWFTLLVSRFAATTLAVLTPDINNAPPLVCLITLVLLVSKSVTILCHCLVIHSHPTFFFFHQISVSTVRASRKSARVGDCPLYRKRQCWPPDCGWREVARGQPQFSIEQCHCV